MAATAVIAGAVTTSLVVGNQQKQKQKGDIAQLNRDLEKSIASAPPPPSTAAMNDAAGQAAANAGAAARRRASGAGGFSSTILTGPQGAPPVQTQRKTLLGQ